MELAISIPAKGLFLWAYIYARTRIPVNFRKNGEKSSGWGRSDGSPVGNRGEYSDENLSPIPTNGLGSRHTHGEMGQRRGKEGSSIVRRMGKNQRMGPLGWPHSSNTGTLHSYPTTITMVGTGSRQTYGEIGCHRRKEGVSTVGRMEDRAADGAARGPNN